MNFSDIPNEEKKKLEYFLSILFNFNRKMNLTSFKDSSEVIEKGFVPVLLSLPYIKEGKCLDIGSGSGIPAIPFSILCKNTFWTLLEPSHKKAGFLIDVAISLKLPIKVETLRAQDYFRENRTRFSTITSRGVKLDLKIIKQIKEHLGKEGRFIFFTGSPKKGNYINLLKEIGFEQEVILESGYAEILVNVPRGTI